MNDAMIGTTKTVFAAAGLAATLLFSASAAHAAACEPDKLATKYPSLAGKTLRVGADPQTPPYVMRKEGDFDTVIGIDADLAAAVFACHGIEYEWFLGGWSGLLPAVISGQIDAMWNNLYYTAERAEKADYVVYMQAGTGALAKVGNPSGADGMGAICGLTVAVGLGTVEEAAVRAESKACADKGAAPVNLLTFPDVAAGVRLVDSGRADILLFDLGFVDTMVANNPDKYSRAFLILTGFEIGVGVKNGNEDLLKAVYDGLQVIQESGKQAEIFSSYNVDPSLSIDAEVKTE